MEKQDINRRINKQSKFSVKRDIFKFKTEIYRKNEKKKEHILTLVSSFEDRLELKTKDIDIQEIIEWTMLLPQETWVRTLRKKLLDLI